MAVRMICALMGGAAAALVTTAVTVLAAVVLLLPVLVSLVFVAIGTGLGFFIGGAAARYLAGERVRKGRMGLACAFVLLVITLVVPGRGSYVALSPDAMAPMGFEREAVVIADYTALILVITTVVGAALAWLGDIWAGGRLRRKHQPATAALTSGEE